MFKLVGSVFLATALVLTPTAANLMPASAAAEGQTAKHAIAAKHAPVAIPASTAKHTSVEEDSLTAKQKPAFTNGITRLAGADRFETGVKISQKFEPGVPVAILSNGLSFADTISASAVAAKYGGPVLLTQGKSLETSVLEELKRLAPEQIFVFGGTGVISKKTADAAAKVAKVKRFGGKDRYETSLVAVQSNFEQAETVFLATGADFPDALSASGPAGKTESPVLLINGKANALPNAVNKQLKTLGTKNIVLVGGTGVISAGIESSLKSQGLSVKRFGGADRYETSAKLNAHYFGARNEDGVAFFAAGNNFPDAVALGAVAGNLVAPLFIAQSASCIPDQLRKVAENYGAKKKVVAGGKTLVNDDAVNLKSCPVVIPAVSFRIENPPNFTVPGSVKSFINQVHDESKKEAKKISNSFDDTWVTRSDFKTNSHPWAIDFVVNDSKGIIDDGTESAKEASEIYKKTTIKQFESSGMKKQGQTFSQKDGEASMEFSYYSGNKNSCVILQETIEQRLVKVAFSCAETSQVKQLQGLVSPHVKSISNQSSALVSSGGVGGSVSATNATTYYYFKTERISTYKPDVVFFGSGGGVDWIIYRASKGWSYQSAKTDAKKYQ